MSSRMEFSAPGKLILFGEWAVLNGHPAVATTLQTRLHCQAHKTNRVGYSFSTPGQTELVFDPKNTLVNPGFFHWAQDCLKKVLKNSQNLMEQQGWHFHFHCEWTLSEGLGSSSAVYLCLKAWAETVLKLSAAPLSEMREELRALQGGRGSGLDLCAQHFGKSVIVRGPLVTQQNLTQPASLVLIHSGKKMDTRMALQRIHPHPAWDHDMAQSVEDFLQTHNYELAISQHMALLENLGVVPDFVQKLAKDLKKLGLATALKTCGAGGGDSLLLWSAPERRQELTNYLRDNQYWVNPHSWNAPGLLRSS